MHPRVLDILASIGTSTESIRPTELYNEGWMLRLVLDWAQQHAPADHPFAFLPDARWYSEALLRPQFLARWRGDDLAESWTNADGVIGHFEIGKTGKGELTLQSNATQLVVIEAKMSSKLSSGTKNAPDYDQAARNVACMAEVLKWAGIQPEKVARLRFYLVAPKRQIDGGAFGELVTKESVRRKVQGRVATYRGDRDEWFERWLLPTLDRIDLGLLPWEALLDGLDASYQTFYDRCLEHNPVG